MSISAVIDLKSNVQLRESVLMEDLAGEAILLDLASENYFALDVVGTRFLTVLTQTPSIQVAYDLLLDEYDVEPNELQQDLLAYVQTLMNDGLVEVSEVSGQGSEQT
jgi:hypothetical protein